MSQISFRPGYVALNQVKLLPFSISNPENRKNVTGRSCRELGSFADSGVSSKGSLSAPEMTSSLSHPWEF